MKRFAFATTLLLVVLLEAKVSEGWLLTAAGYLVPDQDLFHWSLIWAGIFLFIGLMAYIPYVGSVMMAGLIVLAVWPLTGLHFGELDYLLGDLAKQLATNPRNQQEVGLIFTYLHYGVVLIALALLCVVAWQGWKLLTRPTRQPNPRPQVPRFR